MFQRCTKLKKVKEEVDNLGEKDTGDQEFSWSDHLLLILMKIVNWNQCITVKFILEVCGGMGAIWACSEILHWRHEGNTEVYWRPGSIAVGIFFAWRWIWQTTHVVLDKEHHRHLVTEPLSIQKESSVELAHQDLHVSASVRRASQTAMTHSLRSLGVEIESLQLDELDDLEAMPLKEPKVSDGDDAASTPKQTMTTDSKVSSYQSCD